MPAAQGNVGLIWVQWRAGAAVVTVWLANGKAAVTLNGAAVQEGQSRSLPAQGALSFRGPMAQAAYREVSICTGGVLVRVLQSCGAAACSPRLDLAVQLSQIPAGAVRGGVLGDYWPPQLGGKPVRRKSGGGAAA